MNDTLDSLDEDATGKDRQFVNALARGLEILRSFRPGEKFLTNTELAKRTGLPKPTITRLTYTLTKLGYLDSPADRGQYQLASGVLSLGYSLLSNLDVRELARPAMRELAERTRASVSIGLRDRLSMVYVESCRSSSAVTLRLDVGSRIPIATTAMGRALLCGLPQHERDFVLDQIRLQDEEQWPQIKAGVELAFKQYQDLGFCVSLGSWERSISAVGVPLQLPMGDKVMAFNCGGPSFLLPQETLMNTLGPSLVQLVNDVKVSMGMAYESAPDRRVVE
jgi:DNA-binding IclR family transcriptional regulator